jgi:hypothetical protein
MAISRNKRIVGSSLKGAEAGALDSFEGVEESLKLLRVSIEQQKVQMPLPSARRGKPRRGSC